MKTVFHCLLLLVVAPTFTQMSEATEPSAATRERPNILYFYVDDMGWGSIGPNGQAERKAAGLPYVRTPNLDELARQGVNFTRGYGCHVCSPARSSQQSGFHQGHTFADRNDPNNAKKAMRSDDVLIGDALSAAGYATGYWGKWGYGGSKDMENPVIENVQTLPTSHGYQHVLAELHHVRAHTFFQPTLWRAPAARDAIGGLELVPNSMASYRNDRSYPNTPALQNHRRYPDTAYCDDAYAFAALDFVREQGSNFNKTGQPFFGLLAVQIPHAPFGEIESLPQWNKQYAGDPLFANLSDQTRQWAAMVTRIDAHFGNILTALEDPNNDGDTSDSIAENTLVIFQSDNGGPGGKNNVELNANGGLRGTKGSIQEGGIRVPLVMRWPAKINATSTLKAGSNSNMVVDVTDLLPTFCELAKTKTPLGIDGVSIAPTLSGQGTQRQRDFIIHEAGNGQSIIRGNIKLVRGKKTLQLYDLDVDPAEANNLAADHPTVVNELEALLLGERVDQPRGFANTYHRWTGDSGASVSDAANWSDYVYANAGVTYSVDDGAPQLSWTARMINAGDDANTAIADADVEFLALAVGGNESTSASQSLRLKQDVSLTGRNEIRLQPGGELQLENSTVTTLRWIDVSVGAALSGSGEIHGDVLNHGRCSVVGSGFKIDGDLELSESATLHAAIDGEDRVPVHVDGKATLGGKLSITVADDIELATGKTLTILRARKLSGRFDNPGDKLITDNGQQFAIRYGLSSVTLMAK